MPSEKILEQKKQLVSELAEKLKKASAGIVVNYQGINVEKDTKLRSEFRKAGVDYSIIKNTMLRFAFKEAGLEGMDGVLNGATAVAISNDDMIAPAKVFCSFAKDHDFLTVKAGFVEGKFLDGKQVAELAALPGKDVLVAKVLGSLNAPISGFVNVLNGNIRGLVVALNAIAEKQQASA